MEGTVITMPAVALRGLTVFPAMMIHFDINRKRSVAAVEKAMVSDQKVFLVTQRQPEVVEPGLPDLYQVGTIALVKQMVKLPGGNIRVMVEGLKRAELLDLDSEDPMLMARIEELELQEEEDLDPIAREAMCRILKEKLEEYGADFTKLAKEVIPPMLLIKDLDQLMDQIMIQLPWEYHERQEMLEALYTSQRYEILVHHLINEIEVGRVKREFQGKVKASIDKNQRDYILREQMRIIREELGEDSPSSEADEYSHQLESLKADKETKDKLKKEIERFKVMPSGSQEANVLRTYIETLLELPWKKVSRDNNDIRHAEEILNEDHYGLDKVKERILEYLAVRTLSKKGNGPILCLVGPPGTGKTSIARSVARALNKKYVRISLGGVRDEAEIRGHRKTYVGAMPGRLVEGLRQAGVSNPLMLLDEIDKVGNDFRGDPQSALLEVLDPEQNGSFHDNFLDIDYDLSKVMFIATANDLSTIAGPLRDRMEIIEVTGYLMEEKREIAKRHLIPKQLENHGITAGHVTIPDEIIDLIIEKYTRESGVRSLDMTIAKIMRHVARKVAMNKKFTITLDENKVKEYLGSPIFSREEYQGNELPGVVTGLAWTAAGGEILYIESSYSKGKGHLSLTGNLGEVMKESATLALEYIKSHAKEIGIDEKMFEENDIHVHVPAGAVPKDGPSAGITMVTALVSALTGRKVKKAIAMTGEITLRGKVLPVGGIREKILAAKRAGIKEIILCCENKKDIDDIKKEYLKGLKFHYVDHIKEVLETALLKA